LRRVFLRSAGMPRHPFGNTLPESLVALLTNVRLLLQKAVGADVSFSLRVPDVIPPFHSDNDACYLCNPIDLIKFFCRRGCRILRNGPDGRLPGTSLIAGGTWVAVCKSESQVEHPMSGEIPSGF
jgi:hypothetical protein